MLMATEKDLLNIYRATTMVLSDHPQNPIDAIFFHNRSYGDDTHLGNQIAKLIEERQARFAVVTNNEGERFGSDIPFEANPGKTYYINSLKEKGVPEEAIIVPHLKAFHTRQENTAFIEESKKRKWTTAAIIAQPHQLLRTILGAVQAMNQIGYQMEIYTIAPDLTSWDEIVKGNQGAEEKPRKDHIQDELARIILYQSTGELASFDELFTYWQQRGSLKLKMNLPPELQGGIFLG